MAFDSRDRKNPVGSCGCVLRMIANVPRSGSIHIDVPVKPVWPNARAESRVPHEEVGSMVSQPTARELRGTVLRVTNRAGAEVAIPVCLAVRVTDGRIRRIDEYLDSRHVDQLFANTPAER